MTPVIIESEEFGEICVIATGMSAARIELAPGPREELFPEGTRCVVHFGFAEGLRTMVAIGEVSGRGRSIEDLEVESHRRGARTQRGRARAGARARRARGRITRGAVDELFDDTDHDGGDE